MKKERVLRVSGYKDYIAVDEVVDGAVAATPLYLRAGETTKIKYKDEEHRWLKTDVSISDDFTKLNCKDSTGFEWQSDFNELLDAELIRFI